MGRLDFSKRDRLFSPNRAFGRNFWVICLHGVRNRHCRIFCASQERALRAPLRQNSCFRCSSLAAPGPHDARLSAGFVPRGSDGHQIELQKRYAADPRVARQRMKSDDVPN